MKDNYLDHLVKQALDQLDVPLTADAWHLMEQQIQLNADLNPDVLSDVALDETVKNALQNTQLPHPAMDWAAMEARIDADAVLSGQDVDVHFQEVLENIEAPYTPAAWDMMEAQLDLEDNMAELDEADEVDHLVYNKLHNLEPKYEAASWTALAHQLDGLPANRNRLIYRYKLAESGMMLLLFITFFNFFVPLEKATPTKTEENTVIASELAMNTETSTDLSANGNEVLASTVENEINNNNTNRNLGSTKSNTNNISKTLVSSTPAIVKNKKVTTSTTNQSGIVNDTKNTSNPNSLSSSIASTPIISAKNEAATKATEARIIVDADLVDAQASIGLTTLTLPKAKFSLLKNEEQALPGCLTCGLPKTIGIRAAMFWVGDYNHIMTPSDRLFDLEAYNNGSVGYGLGTAVSMTYGRWEVETGAIFSTKVYRPESLVETLGDFESGYIRYELDQIQLNVLQIPLSMRYNFDNLSNWNFYTTAGASLHMVTQTLHDFDSEFSSLPSQKRDGDTGLRLGQLIEENSAFNYKNLSPGWFQKEGSFLENRYFTANLGLGMERSIGTRWSLFTQGMYQHTLLSNGFGPNKDRLNTVSIFAGARASIGSKVKKQTAY